VTVKALAVEIDVVIMSDVIVRVDASGVIVTNSAS
jgi:hypothetical protein